MQESIAHFEHHIFNCLTLFRNISLRHYRLINFRYMRINQPELEPRPNDVTHGVPCKEDGVYNEIEDTYLEVIDDVDITNKHSDNYEMVD